MSKHFSRIGRKEELVLIGRAQGGDSDALYTLVGSMMGLVVRHARANMGMGLDVEELVQEGILGVMTAVEKYSKEEFRLSTYAGFYIHNEIRRAIVKKGRLVKVPDNVWKKSFKLYSMMGIEVLKDSFNTRRIADQFDMSEEEFVMLMEARSTVGSLNATYGEGVEEMLDGLRADGKSAESVVADSETATILKEGIEQLPDAERQVVESFFGLNDVHERTSAELAEFLSISVSAVNRRKQKGLGLLKTYMMERNQDLSDLL